MFSIISKFLIMNTHSITQLLTAQPSSLQQCMFSKSIETIFVKQTEGNQSLCLRGICFVPYSRPFSFHLPNQNQYFHCSIQLPIGRYVRLTSSPQVCTKFSNKFLRHDSTPPICFCRRTLFY